jgi:luciferase family oxidoreductase group 1
MSSPLRLSVLDQSPIASGSSGADALANTIDLACLAEALGYHRYWVAEHHGAPMLAGPSPEALIGPIATLTSGLRVGSGGVMLPHYSPLKVAESFSLLSGLFPGRIDLALGRAAGTDPLTTLALQRDRRQAAPDDFRDQLDELLAYIENRMPAQHPFARLAATLPGLPHAPEPWLLGSSEISSIREGRRSRRATAPLSAAPTVARAPTKRSASRCCAPIAPTRPNSSPRASAWR